MFLKIFTTFAIISLSKAQRCTKPLINSAGRNSFLVLVYGNVFWDDKIITNINATLTDKAGNVLDGPQTVKKNELFVLSYYKYSNKNIDYVVIIFYTKNGNEGDIKYFNIPENCTNPKPTERSSVIIFFTDDYMCNLGNTTLS